MHDPMVVAFNIRRPWPQRTSLPGSNGKRWQIRLHHTHFEDPDKPGFCAGCDLPMSDTRQHFPWWRRSSYSSFWTLAGRHYHWPALVTIWHLEPGGKDSGEVCKHRTRWQDETGTWHSKAKRAWRWHVHHWRIQVIPLQALRRWGLTRCEWCAGRSRKGDHINVSHQWDRERGPWWRGERGLYHHDCSLVETAYRTCTCPQPVTEHDGWGKCARCGRFRGHSASMKWLLNAERLRNAIPEHGRDRAAYERIVAETAALIDSEAQT